MTLRIRRPNRFRNRTLFKMRRLSLMKKSNLRKRRVLATIENLENLSFNTRRFLNRNLSQKWIDDDNRKLKKSVRRRSLVTGSVFSVSSDTATLTHAEELPKLAVISEEHSDKVEHDNVEVSTEDTSDEIDAEHSNETESENLDGTSNGDRIGDENENPNQDLDDKENQNPNKLKEIHSNPVENPQYQNETTNENSDVADDDHADAAKDEDADEAYYNFRSSPKCKYCREAVNSVIKYPGPPAASRTEVEILNLEELKFCDENDDVAQYKLTEFSVFDESGHLCPFDGDLIRNVQLFFSGYVKPIYDDDSEITGGYPCEKMGPMTEWWVAGFDEGEKTIIGFSSELCDYYLLKPTEEYGAFMEPVKEKVLVTKMVMEFLRSQSEKSENSYDDLLAYLQAQKLPANVAPLNEERLIEFADFIYGQILSYDSTADDDEARLMDSYCMKKLAELGEIELTKERVRPTIKRRRVIWGTRKDQNHVKATTTSLVENVFESLFNEQMNRSCKENVMFKPCVVRLTRLENLHRYAGRWKIESVANGEQENSENDKFLKLEKESLKNNLIKPCTVRLKPLPADVLDEHLKLRRKLKRGGKDFSTVLKIAKSSTSKRKVYIDSSESEWEEERYTTKKMRKFSAGKVMWQGEAEEIDSRLHFMCAKVDDELVRVGNFVSMLHKHEIGMIKYMWEDDNKKPMCHLQWFLRSTDTILNDAGHRQELFLTDNCDDMNLSEVDEVYHVDKLSLSEWCEMGNFVVREWIEKNERMPNAFFYQKRYEPKFGRFQDLPDHEDLPNTCSNCGKKREAENREIPMPIGGLEYDKDAREYIIKTIRWRDQDFCVGSSVFLNPGTLMESKPTPGGVRLEEEYDEIRYPEKYRKKFTSEDDSLQEYPFDVGYICEMFSRRSDIRVARDVRLRVKKFYRPHNTHLDQAEADRQDLNLLYWTDEECTIKFDTVKGKCFVSHEKNLNKTVEEWSAEGPHRFYFKHAYDKERETFNEPPRWAKNVGKRGFADNDTNIPPDWPPVIPLRSMDVFAGCGGLSEGLHQSGVARCLWAIEKFEAPAKAFELNNRKAKVYVRDCNDLLQEIIEGKDKKLPQRGDVELLCGGPPCQGFSRMNRFRDGLYSKFKNSLVVTYLSYCDYFRPRFFILENVRDFVSTEKGMIFKLVLSCLVRMGYQVGFSVLQCGKYGIPQSRRRLINNEPFDAVKTTVTKPESKRRPTFTGEDVAYEFYENEVTCAICTALKYVLKGIDQYPSVFTGLCLIVADSGFFVTTITRRLDSYPGKMLLYEES